MEESSGEHLPLQRQTPGDDGHVLRQTHGQQHLRSEDPRVAHLHPLLQPCVDETEPKVKNRSTTTTTSSLTVKQINRRLVLPCL